jgi:hypothetical protein
MVLRHFPTTDRKHSGTSWILSMTLTIWTEVQLQWAVRNDVKYGDTDNTRIGAKISQVLCETAALYKSELLSLFSYSIVLNHLQYSIVSKCIRVLDSGSLCLSSHVMCLCDPGAVGFSAVMTADIVGTPGHCRCATPPGFVASQNYRGFTSKWCQPWWNS